MTFRDDAVSVAATTMNPLVPSKFKVYPNRLDGDGASVVQAMRSTRIKADGVSGVELVGIESQGNLQRSLEYESILRSRVSNEPILQRGTAPDFVTNEHEIRLVAMRRDQ